MMKLVNGMDDEFLISSEYICLSVCSGGDNEGSSDDYVVEGNFSSVVVVLAWL